MNNYLGKLPAVGPSSIVTVNSDEDGNYYEYNGQLRRESAATRSRHRRQQHSVYGKAPISAEEALEAMVSAIPEVPLPLYGVVCEAGYSDKMEDALTVKSPMCRPEICGWTPIHFFGVYDGHGGAQVANLCKDRLHTLLEDEMSCVTFFSQAPKVGSSSRAPIAPERLSEIEEEGWWKVVLARCFKRMDDVAMYTCLCGSFGFQCQCSFPCEPVLVGSTAVIAVLTDTHIVVANVGDSRAVLSRGGRAIPLSTDQKPDRPDEREKIESSGGRVYYINGARVEGILAMSRALGDTYLKQVITAEPEVTFTRRHRDDECLILASDGLWDVMSNEVACNVAKECLREHFPPAFPPHNFVVGGPNDALKLPVFPTRSAAAAAYLKNIALKRMSRDNISVIVVDLKRTTATITT